MKRLDLTGDRYGRWLVAGFSHVSKNGYSMWNCVCDCGEERSVKGSRLRKGRSKSCGCLAREIAAETVKKHKPSLRHGKCRSKAWNSWYGMKQRCNYPKHISYKYYGARGVTVCEEWMNDFEKFYSDMGDCPEKHSLDRIDTEQGYSPENCRWADYVTQRRNRRDYIEAHS